MRVVFNDSTKSCKKFSLRNASSSSRCGGSSSLISVALIGRDGDDEDDDDDDEDDEDDDEDGGRGKGRSTGTGTGG